MFNDKSSYSTPVKDYSAPVITFCSFTYPIKGKVNAFMGKKKLLTDLIALIILILLGVYFYNYVLSLYQTDLKDIDTELAGLCIEMQDDGAPYYALYAICKTYDLFPDEAFYMLSSLKEDNAFYEEKWPSKSEIEKTIIEADAVYRGENRDEIKAREAARLCCSLKKFDFVIDGAFPIDMTVKYSYSDTFGAKRSYGGERTHEGVDIICASGTPVYSVTDGVVIKKGWNTLGGWRLLIKDEYGLEYYYAHLSEYAVNVDEGDSILKGQLIGYSGESGYGGIGTSGQFIAHLHFGIYENGIAVNPYFYIKQYEKNKY